MGFLKTSLWVDVAVMTSKPNAELPNPYQQEVANRMMRLHDHQDLARKYNMHEDDMSFMKEIFMPDDQGNEKPRLPYNQYITEWGYHPMCQEIKTGGAAAKMLEKYGLSFRAVYKIPRPDGKVTSLSVISGMMFYSRKDEPYEILCSADEDEEGLNDPRPYQTDEDLMLLIAKLLTHGE